MKFSEIEAAFESFKACPKCNSKEGFWLGSKHDHTYVQCKGCGADFDLFEVYMIGRRDEMPKHFKLFRK